MVDGFLEEYEGLAEEIAVEARGATVVLGDKIDALKALTPFYVHKMKNMKEVPDTEDLTFDNFQRAIHATEN
jgi:hypothetical protein